MKRRIVLCLFTVIVLLLCTPGRVSAYTSGWCGKSVTYVYNKDTKTLTISGEGDMWDSNAFSYNGSSFLQEVETVVFESGVTYIGSGAFKRCQNLKTVILSDTITHIGSSAFAECPSLKEIYIPPTVEKIGNGAFKQSGLVYVTIPSQTIGGLAFNGCYNLISIKVTNDKAEIGQYAFSSCKKLENVILPDGITTLPNNLLS